MLTNNKIGYTRAISLQGGAAIKSDLVNIPAGLTKSRSATITTSTANKLTDSSANFLSTGTNPVNVKVGDIIINTTWVTAGTNMAYVTNVDSATVLSLSTVVTWNVGDSYAIYSSQDFGFGNVMGCFLYVGTGGLLRVLTIANDDITLTNVSSASILPLQVQRVFSTGTTASNIVALW